MASFTKKYTGTDTIDEHIESVNWTANSNGGLIYIPSTPLEEDESINGVAYHTHYPYEGPNIFWTNVKLNLTHSSTNITPTYSHIISLYGLNGGHVEELVGEKIYTDINSTPTTEIVSFNLIKSASQPNLYLTNNTNSTPGYIDVQLPIRYNNNYDSAILMVLESTPLIMATPSDNDTIISFATPSTWVDSSPVTLTIAEYGAGTITTNNVNAKASQLLALGYDGLDKYDALRLGFDITTTNTPYSVSVDNIEYKYRRID